MLDSSGCHRVLLNSGYHMPNIGLGTWKLKGEVAKATVSSALSLGYKHIDCAKAYDNEEEIGVALASAFASGAVKRTDLFITSKLWMLDMAPNQVRPALISTLTKLGLDYLDLYLIHWPLSATTYEGALRGTHTPLPETWKEMEKLVQEGLIRSIGVSNCSCMKIRKLLDNCTITPAVNQVELHPYWRNEKVHQFCKAHGIHVVAYGSLGSAKSFNCLDTQMELLSDPTVVSVANKLDRSPGQILLRWALQLGVSCIPKSTNPSRLLDNLNVQSWELSEQDMAALSGLPQQRLFTGATFLAPDGLYKTSTDIWDDDE